jgi:hypothetical protein
MRILVAHASRHGATRGIAERIARTLERSGLEVTLRAIEESGSVDEYDAGRRCPPGTSVTGRRSRLGPRASRASCSRSRLPGPLRRGASHESRLTVDPVSLGNWAVLPDDMVTTASAARSMTDGCGLPRSRASSDCQPWLESPRRERGRSAPCSSVDRTSSSSTSAPREVPTVKSVRRRSSPVKIAGEPGGAQGIRVELG